MPTTRMTGSPSYRRWSSWAGTGKVLKVCTLYFYTSARLMLIHSDVTKNVFYWTRVAMVVAQGSGMHRRYVLSFSISLFRANVAVWNRLNLVNLTRDFGSGSGGLYSPVIVP